MKKELHPSVAVSCKKRLSAPAGFTLIELLAVIAIIGVLTSIAFVGVQRSLRAADETTTASNLRQMFIMTQAYASDNKGEIIPFRSAEIKEQFGWQNDVRWFDTFILLGYLEQRYFDNRVTPNVFSLPTLRSFHNGQGYNFDRGDPNVARNIHIGPGNVEWVNDSFKAKRFNQLENPSKTLLITEGRLNAGGTAYSAGISTGNPINWPEGYLEGEAHILFADGHLERLKVGTDEIPQSVASKEGRLFWLGAY